MKIKIIFFTISLTIFFTTSCLALDLDDGIAIDDPIDDYHEMKKIEQNINYKIRNEISKVYTTMDTDQIKQYEDGDASISSVKIGAGAKVTGDIIIIDKSKGNKTAISN